MSESCFLVNVTKRERISFFPLPAVTVLEVAGVPSSATVTTWYLLQNTGDRISFVREYGQFPFPDVGEAEVWDYPDRTTEWIQKAIDAGLLVDCGRVWEDEDDPALYLRDLRNAWMPADARVPPTMPSDQSPGTEDRSSSGL